MATIVKTTFKLRRGLLSAWTKNNPILAEGEPGWAMDAQILKIGDGVTAWVDLNAVTGVDPNDIESAVNKYLEEHPITIETDAIIDVTDLPTENISENSFYRLLTGSLVVNGFVQNAYACHCVDGLPETGEPATNADQTAGVVYYNLQDNGLYGYVDAMLSAGLSVPEGWYPVETLLGTLGYEYAGVITDILEDPDDGAFRFLLERIVYQYKDRWVSMKTFGWSGTGIMSERFNHPSNVASGDCSHAEGANTTASGDCAHAEGWNTTASGHYSHAEGQSTTASGDHSHAEGSNTVTNGWGSHAEGANTTASGDCAHAEGLDTIASGSRSHAEGASTTASSHHQHAQGKWNIEDTNNKYAHIVGNGVAGKPSNAHTLDWDGNAWFQGNVFVGGTGQDDPNARRLLTEDDEDKYVTILHKKLEANVTNTDEWGNESHLFSNHHFWLADADKNPLQLDQIRLLIHVPSVADAVAGEFKVSVGLNTYPTPTAWYSWMAENNIMNPYIGATQVVKSSTETWVDITIDFREKKFTFIANHAAINGNFQTKFVDSECASFPRVCAGASYLSGIQLQLATGSWPVGTEFFFYGRKLNTGVSATPSWGVVE